MSNIYEINEVTHPEVKHARIRLNKGWDIIRVTYTDDGFIQIYSTFGNYAYHWTAMGEGVTLQHFFGERAKGDNEYLANKLWSSTREPEKYFDLDNAIKEVKEYIKDQTCPPDEDEWDEINTEIEDRIEGNGDSRDLFISAWLSSEILNEWVQEIYMDNWGMTYKGRYKTLVKDIIPTIQKYFRGELSE